MHIHICMPPTAAAAAYRIPQANFSFSEVRSKNACEPFVRPPKNVRARNKTPRVRKNVFGRAKTREIAYWYYVHDYYDCHYYCHHYIHT